ncbi:MAG: tetratricopeptide repeat protein [Coriobacteriia bacterium]|nr:tetratricopeptide repeat protein [Coriobacteriia bacterium]
MFARWSDRAAGVAASLLLIAVLVAGVALAYVITTERDATTAVEAAYAEALSRVEADPEDYEARVGLAKALGASGQYGKALNQLEIAAELRPDDPEPLMLMGVVYRMSGSPEKAIEAHERAVDLTEGMGDVYLEAYFELGELFMEAERYEDAANAFEQALAQGPELVYVALSLADAYEQSGDLEAAYEEYVRILPTSPGNPDVEEALERLGGILGVDADDPDQ